MALRLPLFFSLGLAAARLPLLFSLQDTWYPFEVHSGTVALAFLDGVDLRLDSLPVVPHVRGGVLFALLLVPLYALFGPSALLMKLLPLLWHAATVGLLVHVLERFFGRRSALAGGLLFLCAPPAFARLSVLGLASHMESTLPLLAALLPFLAMTVERRFTRANWMAFGCALGFGAFFHLQALLAGLILLALLLVLESREFLRRRALFMLPGLVLLSAPALLFRGGGTSMIEVLLGGGEEVSGGVAARLGEAIACAGGLARGEVAEVLGFADLAGAGFLLGLTCAAVLAIGWACALVAERRGLLGLLRRALLRRDAAASPGAFFVLHALAMCMLLALARLESGAELGSGAAHRQAAPLLFSVLALAAVGLGGRARGARWRTALLLLACAAGAAGQAASVAGPAWGQPAQRGECYEWFGRQLFRAGQARAEQVDLIARVDRGARGFRTLRFALPITRAERDLLVSGSDPFALAAHLAEEPLLFELTALGREVAARGEDIRALGANGALSGQPQARRDALLHGVGLGLKGPRMWQGDAAQRRFLESLRALLESLPEEQAAAVAQGYGFSLGFAFDPYNPRMHEQVALQAALPERLLLPVAIGLGWGYRQRCLEPPRALPEGLAVVRALPAGQRAAFEDGYVGRVLPAEAAVLDGR
ncbi:MAG: glycosyltransferase family 39 protein [Planctomycetes bacterium]|nr:glycosyltransferase family 39 protein [Planctomycetota bacterium]